MLIGNVIKNNEAFYQSQGYSMQPWDSYTYENLDHIRCIKKAGVGDNSSYNDCIIMADTETSKKHKIEYKLKNGKRIVEAYDNHVVAFTVSIRAYGRNIVTLFGHKPSELVECLSKIQRILPGKKTIIYFHNLAYDYTFLRKFFYRAWGFPESALNVKSHEPIYIRFANGLEFRDSLILFQRSLDKVAKDFNVEHQKALGKWDYDKIRMQDDEFNPDELEYIEHDTLAGVEAIDAFKQALNKRIYAIPYTSTGIPREQTKIRGEKNKGHDTFIKQAPTYEQYQKLIRLYHGGYTHANRHYIRVILRGLIECFDFKSSYPYVLLSEKYPMHKFGPFKNCSIDYILNHSENYAWMFKLVLINPRLKNDELPMPVLQKSKCVKVLEGEFDNGRILLASYVEIYLNEIDLAVFNEQYDYDAHLCIEVERAKKDYLPRWFTDYIFELFTQKEDLREIDPILYTLKKYELNSCYGMCVQRYVRPTIDEDYESGDYNIREITPESEREEFEKYVKKKRTVLPYQWGVWCTSYAMFNLFTLGKAATDNYSPERLWIYSDTDSVYMENPNHEAILKYNEICKAKLMANGYGPYKKGDKEVWLGVAEHDGKKDEYSEFVTVGAKRYCGRCLKDNELHITVAGVPKKGVKALRDISDFKKGLIFPGEITGKKMHSYRYVQDIYIDEFGNETGDSVDLSPCDYLLDETETFDWEELLAQQEWYPVREITEDWLNV